MNREYVLKKCLSSVWRGSGQTERKKFALFALIRLG